MMSTTKRLSVITWNVWFEQVKRSERYKEIADVCLEISPDVICFQEATSAFTSILRGHPLLNLYDCSEPVWQNWYGVLSLCKKEHGGKFTFTNLSTNMGRNLLITSIDQNSICIGNVHLESLSNANVRATQLRECRDAMSSYKTSMLVGDFNICSYRNYLDDGKPLEQDQIICQLNGYKDMWMELHQAAGVNDLNRGYTFDTVRNAMIGEGRYEQWRYDRIMYCCRQADTGTETETEAEDVVSCRPISIEIIGDLPVGQNIPALRDADNSSSLSSSTIPEPAQGFSTPPPKSRSSQGIFPSDHFGVHGVFECCTLPCNTDSSKCSLC